MEKELTRVQIPVVNTQVYGQRENYWVRLKLLMKMVHSTRANSIKTCVKEKAK
jgi:hypothetical protein